MEQWTTVIKSKNKLFALNLKELIQYKHLIFLFVKRNFATRYKQMILGPAWIIISPLFTIISYTIIFGNIAGLSTDGIPKPLFYLAGNIAWSFFANGMRSTSNTFIENAPIFGKIYFPRLVVPISTIITIAIDFLIQFIMFLLLILFYCIRGEHIGINGAVWLLPVMIFQLGLLAMGFGIIISALTTKYRDLTVLVGFGLQIWMYASPIIYSVSLIPEKFLGLYMLNPVTPIIFAFKYAFLGTGTIEYGYWGISWVVTLIVLITGVVIFNKVEKTFMDTV